jgi:hypothetical protein
MIAPTGGRRKRPSQIQREPSLVRVGEPALFEKIVLEQKDRGRTAIRARVIALRSAMQKSPSAAVFA